MRWIYLVLGVGIVSGCSQSSGSLPASSGFHNQVTHAAGTGPSIKKITRVEPEQYQTIVISGSGFGTMKPYDGDSAYIRMRDKTGSWDAGNVSSYEDDSVWLDITQWTNTKIVITGFTNEYGEENWVLNKGDKLEFYVWNPQSNNGPATKGTKVK
ncbi:MAG TPA: hypothetical protein VFE16_14500 [Candidatus Cybelea sp.]|jgi:hypothetical protein|nr:hypothetical protein [Candidatus Cybelea sp.]